MGVGCFTDKRQQPTDAQVLEAIGGKLSMWQELARHLREAYPVQEDFKFMYGKNYGWAFRFRVKGQLLTNLYPAQDGFTVQVNLSPGAVEEALAMNTTENVRTAIERADPYPEGRWVFIPVEMNNDMIDVQRLVAMRAKTKRLNKD